MTEGQECCIRGRREISKPGITGLSEDDGSRETGKSKAEVEGEETEAGAGAGSDEGVERVSATTFSGPGTWITELTNWSQRTMEARNLPGATGELHPGEYQKHPQLETP